MSTSIIKPTSCSWFRDAIVYHILVDRFAGYGKMNNPQKPDFIGGNLKGIAGKLPYLIELGINTLWLSPVYESTAYHGYHITDFYTTDKRFGTEKDLKHLIHLCHKNNIRVLLDFVPNHCSSQHPYFREAVADKHSKYRKWFYFSRFHNNYLCFLHFLDLPKINLEYPEARNHIIGAARHWLQLGVDGFRLDHAIGPSHKFWKIFRNEIKSVNSEAVLIGEAWLEGMNFSMLKTVQISRKYLRWLFRFDPWDIAQEYIGEMDGVLDFYFRHRITEFIAWKDNPEQHEESLRQLMNDHYKRFPDNYYLPSFIDNHDMNRFLFDAGQNREKLKMALKFQFSLPQPPILYYGTETGLSHTEGMHWNIPFSDIQARQPMPWNKLDKELINYCKELISDRKKDVRFKT
jgi:cyclomaltodextrinase